MKEENKIKIFQLQEEINQIRQKEKEKTCDTCKGIFYNQNLKILDNGEHKICLGCEELNQASNEYPVFDE